MASKAAEKRFAAMKRVNDEIYRRFEIDGSQYCLQETARGKIAEIIVSELSGLGRTERWQKAIRSWANAVLDSECPLDWAYLQYSVYASHAAE